MGPEEIWCLLFDFNPEAVFEEPLFVRDHVTKCDTHPAFWDTIPSNTQS
jgi:hypothetical protein